MDAGIDGMLAHTSSKDGPTDNTRKGKCAPLSQKIKFVSLVSP
jgi:hypothetical protein